MQVAPHFGTLRVAVHPGDGTVARVGDIVVVVPDAQAPVQRILDAAREISGSRDLTTATSQLERVAADVSSPFAAVVPTAEVIGVFLSGALDVIESDESGSLRRANEDGTRLVRIAEPFGAAVVTGHDTDPPAPPAAARLWDLEEGAVPGAGVSLVRTDDGAPEAEADGSPTAEETGHDEEADEDGDDEDEEEGDAAGAEGEAGGDGDQPPGPEEIPDDEEADIGDVAPTPVVLAEDAHTGVPLAEGEVTLDEALPPAEGPPTSEDDGPTEAPEGSEEDHGAIGMLVLDDGERFPIHGEAVIGRDPAHDRGARPEHVEYITIPDPDQHLSRVHAEIHVEEGEAMLVDVGSANGTYLSDPDEPGWVRLDPDDPVELAHGWNILLGRRAMTYYSTPGGG